MARDEGKEREGSGREYKIDRERGCEKKTKIIVKA